MSGKIPHLVPLILVGISYSGLIVSLEYSTKVPLARHVAIFHLIETLHLLEIFRKTGLSKQGRPRSDAETWSTLFATHPAVFRHTSRH